MFTGEVKDQSQLYGLLDWLRDLGLADQLLLARAGWAPGRSSHMAAASHDTGSAGATGLVIVTAQTTAPTMNDTALT